MTRVNMVQVELNEINNNINIFIIIILLNNKYLKKFNLCNYIVEL
jgi:hypothetical protein